MKIWIKILKAFSYVWLTLAFIFIAVGYFFVWRQDGFSRVLELLSPFNITNLLVTMITLAPGIAAKILADKLKKKQDAKQLSATHAQP